MVRMFSRLSFSPVESLNLPFSISMAIGSFFTVRKKYIPNSLMITIPIKFIMMSMIVLFCRRNTMLIDSTRKSTTISENPTKKATTQFLNLHWWFIANFIILKDSVRLSAIVRCKKMAHRKRVKTTWGSLGLSFCASVLSGLLNTSWNKKKTSNSCERTRKASFPVASALEL